MCGIIAAVGSDKLRPGSIENGLNAIRHRGPDNSGIVYLNTCVLAQVRLSIIDLEAGVQPMSYSNERYWITFNGEIYNFLDLRKELIGYGFHFKTNSDTEVILASYMKWGRDCLHKFRGMFAFVIWDSIERKLFAARDCFGEKPCYFAKGHSGLFLVASEIKALLATKLIDPLICHVSVDAFLALGYVPPNRTIYSNVHTLPPGSYLEYVNDTYTITKYWKPIIATQEISIDEAGEQLDFLLKQAVNRQMIADVPVGAFLSGGLDSSTIVSLMQLQNERPIKTFSVGFGELINELPFARAVAKKYGTDHYELNIGQTDVADLLLKMADIYDEPFGDTSNIPTYLVARLAAKHVKVVLTGDGADELFGGYSWSYPMLVRSENLRGSYTKWVLLRTLSKVLQDKNRSLSLYSSALGLSTRWPDMYTRQFMQSIHIRNERRRELWGDNSYGKFEPYHPDSSLNPDPSVTGSNRGFYYDLQTYLPGDILVKVDRAAMANSLETRAPFLDRDLAEFALSLPVSLKVSNWDTKIIMQHACKKYWPDQLRGRKKQGFGSPIGVWMKERKVKELMENVFASNSTLAGILPGITSGSTKTDYERWLLLTFGLWLDKWHK